jgi:hypothetical protein
MTRYRVAWKSNIGPSFDGHGKWVESRALAEAWAEAGNCEFPDLRHWVETRDDNEALADE